MTLNAKWMLYIMPSIHLLLHQIGGVGESECLPFQSVLYDIILCNFGQNSETSLTFCLKSKSKSLNKAKAYFS